MYKGGVYVVVFTPVSQPVPLTQRVCRTFTEEQSQAARLLTLLWIPRDIKADKNHFLLV